MAGVDAGIPSLSCHGPLWDPHTRTYKGTLTNTKQPRTTVNDLRSTNNVHVNGRKLVVSFTVAQYRITLGEMKIRLRFDLLLIYIKLTVIFRSLNASQDFTIINKYEICE